MSDPILGLTMLGLIVVVIMLGFPTAFTLMGLGMFFGFFAFYNPAESVFDNRIFVLMVQRTYGAMNNDVLISIPLFVLMGYVMERGALVDKMFYSIQLAFRRVPASLAVATLVVCAFWGMASGLVGAVVVLMGVIALNPMLKAGYDVKLSSGVITAGGTLGILIPPSVMIIVYAAVAGQSVVKLYAAAIFPGFFLAFMYVLYIIGRTLINPKLAPKLAENLTKVPVRPWVDALQNAYSRRMVPALLGALVSPGRALGFTAGAERVTYRTLIANFGFALVPLLLASAIMSGLWWYVVIHPQPDADALSPFVAERSEGETAPQMADDDDQAPQELGAEQTIERHDESLPDSTQIREPAAEYAGPDPAFYWYYWGIFVVLAALLVRYYWRMGAEQLEIVRLLTVSIMPLATLVVVVLGAILFGVTTATESASFGAAGAFLLAIMAGTLDWKRVKESVFLATKTTAMVCWLFVGSALFSAVFALLGGQGLIERWVLSLDLSPLQFMLLSQAIIFLLGWPLEWTEIIVIFVPIFLPLLKHFGIDPVLWGTIVFVNLQAAFLSPPVAMSAFYLKGVAPPHITINQIFAGMMPYMFVVVLCMAIMYVWPGLALWLPNYLYN